ncbi:response regulator [Laribacter hongkongensis]|uniref:response regulator n=1 Tax=Laribacter hongkongensis TaxID=168471 RepID=UPI001EFD032B|nr:response regulator [Laribacter hongkongensis]MCG9077508.1 response regulator [Laribacter hongkongensis]
MSRPVPDPDALARLERRAERERRARHEAERLLEQKSLELYSANRLLEARVAERTAELEVALARAEQAGRARSAFLAMMSHEIRTPMNGVIGTADLLAQTGLSAEQLQYVNTIRECGQALTTLIDDILDFSRIDAGKLVLENQPLDLMALLASVCRLFAGAARDKGLTLEFVPGLAGPCGWIMGDAHRIRQIAVNLVGNAIKFTGRGRVSVRLLQAPAAEAGVCELRLAVSDTGIGLTPEAQTRIFAPFEQADLSTTRRFGGSGLGLAICRQLAQLMHGQLEVVSQPGTGSTFSLVWQAPVATPPAVAPAGPVAPDGMPAGLRVLLAEDNPVNQRLALKMLEKLGIRAVLAANGRQAVTEARRMQPDLILMDLQMPECDGLDATRAIRRLEQPQPVIVALTANALAEDREACLAAGMDDHLAKPFTLAELRHMLASQQDRLRARSRAVLPAGPSCPV